MSAQFLHWMIFSQKNSWCHKMSLKVCGCVCLLASKWPSWMSDLCHFVTMSVDLGRLGGVFGTAIGYCKRWWEEHSRWNVTADRHFFNSEFNRVTGKALVLPITHDACVVSAFVYPLFRFCFSHKHCSPAPPLTPTRQFLPCSADSSNWKTSAA